MQRYSYVVSPTDLTQVNVVLRLYAPRAIGGSLIVYAVDSSSTFSPQVEIPLKRLSAGWTDVELPLAQKVGAFNPKATKQIGLTVSSGSDSAWTDPTVVYLDGIRTSPSRLSDTFDASVGPMAKSGVVAVEGASLTWIDSVP
jgi:hypothetical protein